MSQNLTVSDLPDEEEHSHWAGRWSWERRPLYWGFQADSFWSCDDQR